MTSCDELVVSNVRNRLLEEMSAHKDLYDEQDVQSVTTDDWTVTRYVLASKSDPNQAFAMARDAMQWRKTFGVNARTDLDFPLEFYKLGAVFSYGHDKTGKLVIYFRVKMYKNIPKFNDLIKQYLVHIINKCDKQMKEKGCVSVWDLTDAGPSNCDLSFLKFLINIVKSYFPHPNGYCLAFGVHPVISSILKLAIRLLPEEDRHRVIITTRNDLLEYIPLENMPDFLGGTCDKDYRISPDGALLLTQFGADRGIGDKDIEKAMKFYNKYL